MRLNKGTGNPGLFTVYLKLPINYLLLLGLFFSFSVPTLKRKMSYFGIKYYRHETPSDVLNAIQVKYE